MTGPEWDAPCEPAQPWFSIDSDRVRLLRDGAEALPVMLDAIRCAQREILLEMYWIGNDAVGRRFRDALASQARAGVVVRIIYDAVGSIGISDAFWSLLRASGGEVLQFHPISPLHPTFRAAHVEERDHRKVLVVDGTRGFTGGINLAQTWLPRRHGGGGWRDDMIEVEGTAAGELRTLFYKTWRKLMLLRLPVQTLGAFKLPRDLVPLARHPTGRVFVLSTLRRSRRNLEREYVRRLDRASRTIDLANSYFLPGKRVRAALRRAVSRGVRVRVLVPDKSDVAVVQLAMEASFDELLRSGIELYRHKGPMMHSKISVIDDEFAMIGSYNFDERSRSKNLEANVAVVDAPFASSVRIAFKRDLEQASVLDRDAWEGRPILRRGVELVAHALRRLW